MRTIYDKALRPYSVFYDKDMSGFVEVLPRRICFSSKPTWFSTRSKRAVRIRGEDPPGKNAKTSCYGHSFACIDYVELKLEERSHVDAFSKTLRQQRQKVSRGIRVFITNLSADTR
jgi:hypothetical protein